MVQVIIVPPGAAGLIEDVWPREGCGFSGLWQLSGFCSLQCPMGSSADGKVCKQDYYLLAC